jgi:hypothetical protein
MVCRAYYWPFETVPKEWGNSVAAVSPCRLDSLCGLFEGFYPGNRAILAELGKGTQPSTEARLRVGKQVRILGLLAIQAQGDRRLGTESFKGNRFSTMGTLLVGSGVKAFEREIDLLEQLPAVFSDSRFNEIVGSTGGLFFQIVPVVTDLQTGERAMRPHFGGDLLPLLDQPCPEPFDFLLFHSRRE